MRTGEWGERSVPERHEHWQTARDVAAELVTTARELVLRQRQLMEDNLRLVEERRRLSERQIRLRGSRSAGRAE